MSDFGYNETVANDYFPLTKSEALTRDYPWKDEDETQSYHGDYHATLPLKKYDENQSDSDTVKKNIDDCISQVHLCEQTKKPFKIIPKELAYYLEN